MMNLFQRYLAEEFAEDYEEGRISRREALKLIASVTGSVVLANSFLAACSPPPDPTQGAVQAETAAPTLTAAQVAAGSPAPSSTTPSEAEESPEPPTVSPDEPAIEGAMVEIPAEGGTLMAYMATPGGEGPYPVVLVCHENRGLTEHIKDVTRRLASAGYVALAIDLLSRQGGSQAVGEGGAPGALGSIPPEQFAQDFRSGWEYLQEQPFADADRTGMVGFCFGGGVTWLVATRMPELKAAVPYYGPHPPVEDVASINAPVLAIYAGNDDRINQGIPAIEEAMAANGKTYEKVVYPGTDHAFHNDTGPRYDPDAAADAWSKTLAWFEEYL